MKAFRRFAREERAARLVELPVPEPAENQVLLRVSHCGICGSDLHAWLNHKATSPFCRRLPSGMSFPERSKKLETRQKCGAWAIMPS